MSGDQPPPLGLEQAHLFHGGGQLAGDRHQQFLIRLGKGIYLNALHIDDADDALAHFERHAHLGTRSGISRHILWAIIHIGNAPGVAGQGHRASDSLPQPNAHRITLEP